MIVWILLFQLYHYTRIPVVLSYFLACPLTLCCCPFPGWRTFVPAFAAATSQAGTDILPPFVYTRPTLSLSFSFFIPVH